MAGPYPVSRLRVGHRELLGSRTALQPRPVWPGQNVRVPVQMGALIGAIGGLTFVLVNR